MDVARIFIDADERLEQPVISRRLPLTKIHHVAFDAHLIGVDLITEFTSPIGCSKSTRALSSNLG